MSYAKKHVKLSKKWHGILDKIQKDNPEFREFPHEELYGAYKEWDSILGQVKKNNPKLRKFTREELNEMYREADAMIERLARELPNQNEA